MQIDFENRAGEKVAKLLCVSLSNMIGCVVERLTNTKFESEETRQFVINFSNGERFSIQLEIENGKFSKSVFYVDKYNTEYDTLSLQQALNINKLAPQIMAMLPSLIRNRSIEAEYYPGLRLSEKIPVFGEKNVLMHKAQTVMAKNIGQQTNVHTTIKHLEKKGKNTDERV